MHMSPYVHVYFALFLGWPNFVKWFQELYSTCSKNGKQHLRMCVFPGQQMFLYWHNQKQDHPWNKTPCDVLQIPTLVMCL